MRGTITKAVAQDASLRKSRSVFVTLAIVFFIGALISALFLFAALFDLVTSRGWPEGLHGGWVVFWVLTIVVEYMYVQAALDAHRKIKQLREDPTK